MRIYSDVLTSADVAKTAHGVLKLAIQPIRRPKLRRHGWNAATAGYSRRWKNTGNRGASVINAASWDDHGRWMARLYEADPQAVIVAARRYTSAEDFHAQTGGKYRG